MKSADLIWLGQRLADAGRLELRSREPDVSPAEWVVLRGLLDSPAITITALAKLTGYAQSRVSTAVAQLVERGWAATRSDPADGRRTLVFLPDEFRAIAHEAETGTEAQALEHLLAGHPAARRKAIVSALEELHDVLREQSTDP